MPEAPSAPAPAAPAAAPVAPIPSGPAMRGGGANMAAALGGFDKYAKEPSSQPNVAPEHPSDTARKKNEAAKAAPVKPVSEKLPETDSNIPEPSAENKEGSGSLPAVPDGKPATAELQKEKPKGEHLRDAYAREKAARQAAEKKIAELTQPKEDTEKKELSEKLTAAEKRAQEREEELRFVNYERSEEYQTKYFKPYVEAYQAARQDILSLDVVERTVVDRNTNEERVIAARPAIAADFDEIVQIADDRVARNLAKEKFGADFDEAVQLRKKVRELSRVMTHALNEQRTKGAEREKMQAEQRSKQQVESKRQREEMWSAANKEFAEKHKEWFEPVEGDEIGNKMLAQDIATTDLLFGDTSHLAPDKVIKMHSQMRNRAAAAGRLAHMLKQSQSKVTELQEKLKGYEASEPKEGEGLPEKQTPGSGRAIDGVFADLEKRSRPASSIF